MKLVISRTLLSIIFAIGSYPNHEVSALRAPYSPAPNHITIPPSLNHKRHSAPIQCEHFGTCPGCLTDSHVAKIPIVESASLYFNSASVQKSTLYPSSDFYKTVIPSEVNQWRTQAKLAVAPKSTWGRDGCIFGLYQRKSHTVVPIPNCAVHHPSINRAVEVLTQATAKVGTQSFREDGRDSDNGGRGGGLRYVQLSVERMTGKVALTLVWNAEQLKDAQPGLSRLIKECKRLDPKLWHSVWGHTNANLGNAIFARGERNWHPIDGPEFVREPIPGTDLEKKEGLLHFSPMAFRQGNMDGFEAIALHVAKGVPPGAKVCELYAGVGLLGLTALTYHAKEALNGRKEETETDEDWWGSEDVDMNRGEDIQEPLKWVKCSDENPANPRCFNRSVNTVPKEVTGRISRFKKAKHHKGERGSKGRGGKQTSKNNNDGEKTLEDLMQDMMSGQDSDFPKETNGVGPKGKITYMVASASKALHEGQALGADTLIVDPPRKGLEEEVLVQLCKPHNPNQMYTEDKMFLDGPRYAVNWVNDVNTLIYVSCGFDALARDCDRLLKGNAGWKLESATGYVLFPGSNHVETLAIFKRRAGGQR